jgi:hypothetical protein
VQKRKDWHTRQTDPIFKKLPPEFRPLNPPLPPDDTAAEEMVLLPCTANRTLCIENVLDMAAEQGVTVIMVPVSITRVIDEKIVMRRQALFTDRQLK